VVQLHRASKASRMDREEMLARITTEHQSAMKFNNVWLEDFNERVGGL